MAKKLFIILVVLSAMFNISFANEVNSDIQMEQSQEMEMQEVETVEVSEQEAGEMEMVENEQEIEEKEEK